MPGMIQTFTIFHDEMMMQKGKDGADPVRKPYTSVYPGFGADPHKSLDSIMEDIAENDSDELQEDFSDDPEEYASLLAHAIDSLPGTWEVYAGAHKSRPEGTAPLITEGE